MSTAAHFRRPPSEVMRMARMGSAHPTRLSFLRVMLRRMRDEGWRFDRPVWEIDEKGVGRAVYRAKGPERSYCLVAFAHDLPPEMRSDRVIATAWDATFALFDGEPTRADLDRLEANVPLQEAGRIGPAELSLSRANRSVRLFSHVVERLAEGQQPDPDEVDAVGYLMRTTAVYGSGKFGAADRAKIGDRPEMAAPFQAEMLSVWLTREFTVDLVEHLAAVKGGAKAARLEKTMRRSLGVGNSTGLGMAPFLVRHPVLLNNWMAAKEEALARVRALPQAGAKEVAEFRVALLEAIENATLWKSEHPIQMTKLADLRGDMDRIEDHTRLFPGAESHPWDALWRWGERLSLEGQEALLALILEPHGALIDDLAATMSADESASFRIDGEMSVGALRALVEEHYDWALAIDFAKPESAARFWYVSEEKLEPRLGDRHGEAGAEREQPLGVAKLASELHAALAGWADDASLAEFLLARPDQRYMTRRAQIAASHPFAEVQDNLLAADMLPIDIMRCKLAFFGASRFDPRSDKWVRISLFQGEPHPSEMPQGDGVMDLSGTGAPEPNGVELSDNEVESLCLKASRGAGLDWGLAEEAGQAARWLAAHGLDGPTELLHHLLASKDRSASVPSSLTQLEPQSSDPLCPIHLGAALSDLGLLRSAIEAGPVAAPVLLLPFLARVAGAGGVELRWEGGSVSVGSDGIKGDVARLAMTNAARVVLGPIGQGPTVHSGTRVALEKSTVDGLSALAMNTTVPATEQSRSDAGAKIDDND
ncbi:MAG TPA: DUF3726 domain-containing protein [Paracoccaceae bacterium]|nr:DUF3726 domain-containing protein [Paracoccaceae bacterium]